MDEWLDVPELVEKIQEYLEIGLDAEALKLLDRYSEIYRDEWEIDFLYSRLYSERGEPEKAVDYLERCLNAEGDNLDCLLGMFYAQTQMERMDEAWPYLSKAYELHPRNDLVLNALIWYYTETSDFAKAIDTFSAARDVLSDNPEALRNIGIAYERAGEHRNAEKSFSKALKINPRFEEVRDLLADHFILTEEPDKSIKLYRDYLKISPNNIRTLSRLVFCLSQNNEAAEAEKLAGDTISLYPNSAVGYVDLAYVHLNNGKPELAIKVANQALDVSPIDAEALRVKGIAYSERKNNDKARAAFEEALRLEPENPEIMRDYYHHLREAGHHDRMKELVQRVIKQEQPYCMEDYWFLADFYQEQDRNLKAFHYLHLAYKCMPGEKELIPPMADIMLERGHAAFVTPFLKRYVESKGWNDVMDELSRHRRFRGSSAKEGLRLLRFFGERPGDYRRFIFRLYAQKCLFIAGIAALAALVFLAALFAGVIKATAFLVFVLAVFLGWKATTAFLNRRRPSVSEVLRNGLNKA